MRVHLGGHLSFYDTERRSWVDWPAAPPVTLAALADRLGVPRGEIALAVLNGRQAALDDLAQAGDQVEFFPPMGGG
jgi:molybdopterin converting factor small subunit